MQWHAGEECESHRSNARFMFYGVVTSPHSVQKATRQSYGLNARPLFDLITQVTRGDDPLRVAVVNSRSANHAFAPAQCMPKLWNSRHLPLITLATNCSIFLHSTYSVVFFRWASSLGCLLASLLGVPSPLPCSGKDQIQNVIFNQRRCSERALRHK